MTSREHAATFVRAYGKPNADDYDRHLFDFAKRWLELMDSEHPSARAILDTLSELQVDHPDHGTGWIDLQLEIRHWARTQ